MSKTYTVTTVNSDRWRDCGHNHKSIRAAVVCMNHLKFSGCQPGQTRATWAYARIFDNVTKKPIDPETEMSVRWEMENPN